MPNTVWKEHGSGKEFTKRKIYTGFFHLVQCYLFLLLCSATQACRKFLKLAHRGQYFFDFHHTEASKDTLLVFDWSVLTVYISYCSGFRVRDVWLVNCKHWRSGTPYKARGISPWMKECRKEKERWGKVDKSREARKVEAKIWKIQWKKCHKIRPCSESRFGVYCEDGRRRAAENHLKHFCFRCSLLGLSVPIDYTSMSFWRFSSPFAVILFISQCLLLQMELQDLLKPISDHIQEIQNFRERNRGSSLFNHLSAVSESIPALGWVAVVRNENLIK